MSVLCVNRQIEADVAFVIRHAERNVLALDEIEKLIRTGNAAGCDTAHHLTIPVGFKIVFTLEQQPIGLCRHLSVRVDRQGKYPNEFAVAEIAKLFGMDMKESATWIEEEGRAVHLLQPYK